MVAVLEGETPKVITNSEGSTRTPSVVSFSTDKEIVVGDVARRQGAVNPTRTVYSIKRLMGRTPADIEALGLNLPYELASSEDSRLLVKIDETGYTPAQISSVILSKLKQAAEDYLGEDLTKAIITVPAYFDDLQRQATREAGKLAGLEILRLVNEPTAAAMAYGLGKESNERVAVYDFGGGTFDLTIIDITDGTFEVLTSQGDTHLGGDDLDFVFVDYLLGKFRETVGEDYQPDDMGMRRLTEAAEKAKCELSLTQQTLIHLPFLAQINGVPMHLDTTIDREEFEDLIEPFIERTLECCRAALEDCDLRASDIDKVILVGGTTRIPLLQDMVEEFFGIAPFKGINPDEIVALGAATQAGVLAGKLKEVILLDVAPHTLGVEVADNRMARVIEKNTTIPAKVARLFTTTEDGQEMVTVHVMQGDSEKASENRSLGKFVLSSITPGKAGSVRVQVAFQINADGMVEVTAEDMATHQQESLSLTFGGEKDTVQAARERVQGMASARRRKRRSRKADTRGGGTGEVLTGLKPAESQVRRHPEKKKAAAPAPVPVAEPAPAPAPAPAPIPADVAPAAPAPAPDPAVAAAAAASREVAAETTPAPPPTAPEPKESGAPASPSDSSPALTSPVVAAMEAETLATNTTSTGLSSHALKALALIREKASSSTAYEVYLKAYAELQDYARSHTSEFEIASGTARILITLGERDAARSLLKSLSEASSAPKAAINGLFEEFLERFPMDSKPGPAAEQATPQARENVDTAIRRLENVVTEDSGSREDIEALVQLYRRRLAHGDDSSVQFKLVKLLVRLERIDEAINILQRLVQQESYRTHSLKILGLCFWQKGLHYLAWQKFQQLPPSDEIKDILYRLASDMEDTDQLLNAKVVFQHLNNLDSSFRDTAARLEKLEQRIRNATGNQEAALTPSIFLTLKDSRFSIIEEVNRGSMGIVYRAKDTVLEEIVALKILNDYMTTDPSAVERFKREARAAKRLSHPNIVRIHDMFEYGNKKLLSMEFIEGVDLKSVLADRRALALDEIVRITKPVCEALSYAHQQSIVHRDIKPANIMITNDNQVKVTDFGIAKLLLAGPDATRSGSQIIGTPLYMSPEQILGGNVDARADIYSLGATIYEMAVGRPPFLDGNIEYHHLHTPPPSMPDNVPLALQQLVLKCLEKKPEDRYASIRDLGVALSKLEENPE